MQRLSMATMDRAQQESWKIQDSLLNAARINNTKQEAIDIRNQYYLKLTQTDNYLDRLSFITKGSMLKMEQFRNECLKNLEERVEAILALIMPEEQFKVRITFRTVRGKYISEVYTGKEKPDGTVVWSKPRSANGDFIKQLVSFSIVCSLNLMLGSTKVLMDEPFSSSDNINVGKLQPVFDMMLDAGLQVIIIEHKDALYEHSPHNEISLLKHRHPTEEYQGFVEVLACERKESEGYGESTAENTNGRATAETI
ncbi:MAG: hypothetical protein RSC43_00055 [Clostridia bacterium]